MLTRAHVFALIAIVAVTWINVVGLRWGTILQNLATWAKFAAMAAFVILGFAIGKGDWHHFSPAPGQSLTLGLSAGQLISAFGVALIAVFWAYDGWVYITWVSGEVKEPRRNVPRAMVLGVVAVGVIYMAMNMTYVYALPLGRDREARNHRPRRRGRALLSRSRAVAVGADCGFLLRRDGELHHERRARLFRHGAGRRLLPEDGGGPSQVADARVQPDRPGHLGRGAYCERPLRPALHLRDVRHGAFVHHDRGRACSSCAGSGRTFRVPIAAPDIHGCPAIYVMIGGAWTLNTIVTRPTEAFWGAAIVLIGVPGYLYWKRMSKKARTELPDSLSDLCGFLCVLCG